MPLFSSSPGQVAFTPGGREPVVTTKSANTVEVFPMTRDGRPARRAVVNDSAGAVPFAITFDKAGRMLVAEAKESTVSTYEVRVDGTLEAVQKSLPNGQNTLCWLERAGDFFYGGNTGSSTVTGYRTDRRAGWRSPTTSGWPPCCRPSPKASSTWRCTRGPEVPVRAERDFRHRRRLPHRPERLADQGRHDHWTAPLRRVRHGGHRRGVKKRPPRRPEQSLSGAPLPSVRHGRSNREHLTAPHGRNTGSGPISAGRPVLRARALGLPLGQRRRRPRPQGSWPGPSLSVVTTSLEALEDGRSGRPGLWGGGALCPLRRHATVGEHDVSGAVPGERRCPQILYEVTVEGTTVSVRYGRIGVDGQRQTSAFPTVEKANAAAAKKIAEKVRKGYAPAVQGQRAALAVTHRQATSAPSTARATAPVLWRFRTGASAFGIHCRRGPLLGGQPARQRLQPEPRR